MKKYYIFIFFMIIGGFVLFFQKPIRISYHKYMKGYCDKKAMSFPPLDDNKTKYFSRSKLHLQRLVQLGYYERKFFTIDHIKTSTPESKKIWSTLINSDICKDNIIESNDAGEDNPLEIIIYAPPKYMPKFEDIIQSFDDYSPE